MLVEAKKEVFAIADEVVILIGLAKVLLNLNIKSIDTAIVSFTLVGSFTRTLSTS